MPFHAATENMAALLRSARLLKISPSGVLHITGTKRNGPPLSRLYCGALGGTRTGAVSRILNPATGNVSSSRVWQSAVGCMRGYALAADEDDVSINMRSKQAQQFDWALNRLDKSVRNTGRITKTLLLRLFHDICRTGYSSGNQALLLLRSCGTLLPEVPGEERTALAHRMWEKLKESGAHFDVSHYNALLKVYLQNEFKFSPMDFLAKMEAANVVPNRVTYQRLIAAYCQTGDIEGASTILGYMKSKELPITEAVFNALIMGHACGGDIESAKNIPSVMRAAGVEPSPDTYIALLNVYAEKGDMESVTKVMEEAKSADCNLVDRDIMQVIFTMARAGHSQYVPDLVERFQQRRGFLPDAMNLCLSLITVGQEDAAFHVLKTFKTTDSDQDLPTVGNFFIRHCVNMDMPVEKMMNYCKELEDSNKHHAALTFCLFCALEAKKTEMCLELLKRMKEQGRPVRPHFFAPLLSRTLKDKDEAGTIELLKAMQELGVPIDSMIMSNYILPVFPSLEAAQQIFTEEGIHCEKGGDLFISEVRVMAAENLEKLYTTLSDPSFPALPLQNFRNGLCQGFKRCKDLELMMKLTDLIRTDKRFTKEGKDPAETMAYFLLHFFDYMTDVEVQAAENHLRKYLEQLQMRNITIPLPVYRGIKGLLDTWNVPELLQDVIKLVDVKDPLPNAPRQTLQQALERKQQDEADVTPHDYATLISLYCRQNNMDKALDLKREMDRKGYPGVLNAREYIRLVRALSENDRIDDAVAIMEEMKEKDITVYPSHLVLLFHMFNSSALKGDRAATIQKLQKTVFSLGLAKPSANFFKPLITAYLESNDLPGALDAAIKWKRQYNEVPPIHDITVALVEKGDTENLQKAMDFMSRERGEANMLYDLFFAFLQTGRYKEARTVIESPQLRAIHGRLRWFSEKCISNNWMETLEQMVDMTVKLFECDRDEMYAHLLQLYKEQNNWQKALAVWTKMQEENIIPREKTMHLLADILKRNSQEVPFDLPEAWYPEPNAEQLTKPEPYSAPAAPDINKKILVLSKKGQSTEAFALLKQADAQGKIIRSASFDQLIRVLLSEGNYEDAMEVKSIAMSRMPNFAVSTAAYNLIIITLCKKGQVKDALENLRCMIKKGHMPLRLSITRLVRALSSQGEVAGIQEVESVVQELGICFNQSVMLFINNLALAHIENGDMDSAVELLESAFSRPDLTAENMSYVFKKLLEDGNDKALDRLSAMAERLANHFGCCKPATDLFLQLVDRERYEEAESMLDRCAGVAEEKEKVLLFVAARSQRHGQLSKVKYLANLIPDLAEKDVLYTHLMACHAVAQDLESAKALYQQMQEEGVAVENLSLKRLALLYRKAGEEAPFPEPPEHLKFYVNELKERTSGAATSAAEE